MDQSPPLRLPAQLDSAAHRVRTAAREAAEQTVGSLGLAALSTHGVLQRDALLGAQYELNRKLALFGMAFNEALDTDIARQVGALTPAPDHPGRRCPSPDELVATWDTLSLVDDHEVELHLTADRFARETGHHCEWEIRELDAYVASLLHFSGNPHERNPLRAEVIGQALVRAVEAVAERPEVRKVLCTEVGHTLAQLLRPAYGAIIDDLRGAGIKPKGLTVRQTPVRAGHPSHGALPTDDTDGGGPAPADAGASGAVSGSPGGRLGGLSSLAGANATTLASPSAPSAHGGFAPSTRSGLRTQASLGRVDPGLMALIHQIHALPLDAPNPDLYPPDDAGVGSVQAAKAGHRDQNGDHSGDGPIAPNLIHAYRDALRQAAGSALDHRVIDVVAGLFDQILADTRVPPLIARLIARLQLPVLRAALGDASFFSSRRHPVRRFVNRIASLGAAVEDFASDEGRALLARVTELVQELVEGDFEQASLYEQKLSALEGFVREQALATLGGQGQAVQLLARKEDELRVQQRYAQQLDGALEDLPLQDYLRHFLATTWSRAIANAELQQGAAAGQQRRDVGRELVMSVLPKGTPALRQAFLQRLPGLMKALNQGMDSIGCDDELRREFFARLLPAHADSLKGQPLSTLEMNLLSRQVEGALATPVPQAADLPPAQPGDVQALASASAFSAAEASAVGLVQDRAVDWNGQVDIDLGSEPEITAVDIDIDGLPAPEPVEPSRGKSLVDHVQIGFAYRMHLDGQWQTVRLKHVSPARSFFVFSHGPRQQRSLSLTYRMLSRMGEAGRLRAVENAYLLERATARARRQLAQLLPARGTGRR